WETVESYVSHVAPSLADRLERWTGTQDVFSSYRVDEQIAKALDRKVWLPSGGSLVIDRTEAMTVIDVNTGKFTGSGGNLEETVTKNNLEAAEEVVRQLRLRDIGGIIVVDFIDMVLESNRDLVLRRLVECLGRDRTRHQVAEVTSLGLVQMTRKRIGTGLLEAFSEPCTHCGGRGLLVTEAPVEPRKGEEEPRRARRSRSGRGSSDSSTKGGRTDTPAKPLPSPKDVAAMARPADHPDAGGPAGRSADESPGTATADAPPEAPAAAAESAEPTAEPVEQTPEPTVEPTVEPVEQAPEPVAPPAEPEAPTSAGDEPAPQEASEPERSEPAPAPTAPTVVTRTRRRSARRPAGPPTTGPADGSTGAVAPLGGVSDDGAVEPAPADAERAPAPVEHVPVKKRGARKR
ncbi:MAG TPA: ribonuclease E/G, partial [Nocardioides sp.]|nr:ribonuclease E/G [Nocardioides sp.]